MPRFRHADTAPGDIVADVLVVGVTSDPAGDDGPESVRVDDHGEAVGQRLGVDLREVCAAVDVDGSIGSRAVLPAGDGLAQDLVVVVGLGPTDEVDADALRAASGVAARVARRKETVVTMLHRVDVGDPLRAASAVVEGTELAHHEFRAHKTDDDTRRLDEVVLAQGDADAVAAGLARGRVVADATMLARDLGNTPAGDKRPPALAEHVRGLFDDLPVEVEVWDGDRLRAEGFGGHLGVAAGSSVEPRFVQVRYAPDDADRHVALVGKGITFDSGGLSLKTPSGMEFMKIDMAGAAAVLASVRAAAQLDLPVRLTGMLCLAENMPSGSATRPGDVITMHGGTTVEVLNTDAEGRLVMADALAHAGHLDPPVDQLVDLATLTGAAVTAVGPRFAAVMGDDDDLVDELLHAADRAAEPMWRLPLAEDQYGSEVKSEVADVRNVGGKGAGTIRAALFLHEFVPDDVPWAHLDIAGPSWNDDRPYGGYVPRGATGIPVRTILEWLGA